MKAPVKLVIGIMVFFAVVVIGGFILMQKILQPNVPEEAESPPVEIDHAAHLIGEIGETARDLAKENDLYASVLLAQAILESNQGRSGLATTPNFNLFGMKGKYQEASVELKTEEDDGEGNMTTITAEFRKYPSHQESIEDYIKLLREGVSWDETFYEGTYKSNTASYKEATAFLTGTYASDSQYEEKLNQLIEHYDLQKYDAPENHLQEVNAE